MSNFLLCIGGTGARIGESFVHLAATGFVGEGTTQIWLVDKDDKCGNGSILKDAVRDYNAAQKRLNWPNHECLNHNIEFHHWDFSPALNQLDASQSDGQCSFGSLQNMDKTGSVGVVMQLLHDVSSLESSMDGGFYGRAQTGTALFNAMTKTQAFADAEQNLLYNALERSIQSGETNVFLAGSSFGATGASMLPNLAENIRKQYTQNAKASNLHIGAVLMLPYFKYEKPAGTTQRVSPDTHWKKASEALIYYHNHVTIRKENQPLGTSNATFDSFYIVGMDPTTSINSRFADKGTNQSNDPHIAELFAAISVKNFYDLKVNEASDLPATYAYSLGNASTAMDWTRLHDQVKVPVLDFTRFCISVLTFLHPLVYQAGSADGGVDVLEKDDTLQKCFGSTGIRGSVKKAKIAPEELRANLKDVAGYAKDFFCYFETLANPKAADGEVKKPDMALFDAAFLASVSAALLYFAAGNTTTLRNTVLCTEYKKSAIVRLRELDQPTKIIAKYDTVAQQSKAMSVMEDTINYMKPFAKKSSSREINVLTERTNNGMKEIYEFIYKSYGVNSIGTLKRKGV